MSADDLPIVQALEKSPAALTLGQTWLAAGVIKALYAELQQFVNGVETHMIDSPADDILANVTHRAKLALKAAEQSA